MNNTQYQVAIELGYPMEHVKRLLQKKKYETASDLIDDLEQCSNEMDEEGEKQEIPSTTDINAAAASEKVFSLREETEMLYHRSICLVCKKNKRTRVILPCSHLSHCESCNSFTRRCPLVSCQELIEWSIEIFS